MGRFVGAQMIEINDEWAVARRYMGLEASAASSAHVTLQAEFLPEARTWAAWSPPVRTSPRLSRGVCSVLSCTQCSDMREQGEDSRVIEQTLSLIVRNALLRALIVVCGWPKACAARLRGR
jgi:hypothetical protein